MEKKKNQNIPSLSLSLFFPIELTLNIKIPRHPCLVVHRTLHSAWVELSVFQFSVSFGDCSFLVVIRCPSMRNLTLYAHSLECNQSRFPRPFCYVGPLSHPLLLRFRPPSPT